MRYLIDTNIFLYLAVETDCLDKNVIAIVEDPDNVLCMSSESLKELVVGYNNRSFATKKWKTCESLIRAVSEDYGIVILPVDESVIRTYSRLQKNEVQGHKDPSDHVIISQAITLGIPLISSDTRFPFYTKQGLELIVNKK